MLRVVIVCFLVLTLGACAAEVIQNYEQPVVHIYNSKNIEINIHVRPCGTSDESYKSVMKINSGTSNTLNVSEECIDAKAVDMNNEVVGTQHHLRVPPEVYWNVR